MYGTFTDRSTHFVNSFVAVGNAELSNKMASYMRDQRMFVIKTYYSYGCSCVAVGRQYGRKFSVRVLPSRGAIYRTVKQAEERGIMCDKCAKGRKRGTSVRTKGLVSAAWEAITKSPKKSV
jgi:hypothetical protein